MKRLYFIISLLFVINSLFSQESSQNYVLTRTFLNESGTKYIDNIQYFDGLGRPTQTVQKGVTPNRSNLVTLQEYDGFGRATKSWLPHVSTSSYLDPVSFKSVVPGTYNGDSRPYDETVYEDSPLNRVVKQYGPGASWGTHPVSTSYLTNDDSKELVCKYYYVTSTDSLAQDKVYPARELYVAKSTDEDGNVSYLFTDKLGRQLLSRQMSNATPYDTYYVYDDFDNLRFVLPPGYQDTDSLSLFAYQYKYDEYGRCIEKTLPGCEVVKYVYDKADNLIFSQDGVQRKKGEWTFYLYDLFHRLVMRGICTNTNTSLVKSQIVKTQLSRNSSTRMILAEGIGDTGYSSSFGISSPVLHTVNYYDDYTFLNLSGFSGKEGGSVNAKGLLTGNITFDLDGYTSYCTVSHYDTHGRVTKVISDNAMRGTETTTTSYTFTGKPLVVEYSHVARSVSPPLFSHTETYRYTYDHAERLTKVTHQLDEDPSVVLSENAYDELGRLQSKRFHGNSNLTTNYSYNIRNWVTKISGNSFKQSLYYDSNDGGSPACFNGNVSVMEWRVGTTASQRYDFSYDALNRLLSADYSSFQLAVTGNFPNFSERVLEYDKQGNIRRLQRYGKDSHFSSIQGPPKYTYPRVDDLTLNYRGNQLINVSDAGIDPLASGSFNYIDLHDDGSDDFAYDANGNLTKDLDKDINSISYNCLNLPEEISFTDNGNPRSISYSYDANGLKLSAEHVITDFTLTPMSSLSVQGNMSTSSPTRHFIKTFYGGNVIYKSNNTIYGDKWSSPKTRIERILTEEGYITLDGEDHEYHYYLKDHLGNIRVVMNQDGETIEQSNNYYPFGGIFESTGDGEQPYKFGGKEFDPMHGLNWCDFGNRYLRNDGPGWMSIDPLCEKYYSISPYVYCNNNPVNCIDPDGRDWYQNNTTGAYYWQEGHEPIDGYTYIGPEVSIQLGQNSYFNAYQNAGVVANKAVSAFDLIYSNGKLQNQFLGKDSPLSENSKSELFNGLVNREVNELGLELGQRLLYAEAILSGIGSVGSIGRLGNLLFKNMTKGGKTAFFKGAKYSNKVVSQMKKADDIVHSFPKSVDGYATKFGQWSIKIGADGKVYQWLEMPGSYGGKTGVFEYIKDANGIINHRYFKIP